VFWVVRFRSARFIAALQKDFLPEEYAVTHPHLPAVLVVAMLGACPLVAAPPAAVDLLGDPLPAGAVARLGTLRQRSYYTYDVRFSPGGKTIQTISGHRNLWCEWDAATGALLRTRRVVRDGPGSVAFTPDLAAYAVESGKDSLRVANTFTGKTLAERELPPGTTPDALAFSPDGKRIALSGLKPVPRGRPSADKHFVAVWNFETDALRLLEDLPGQINDVRFSADGKRLAVVTWAEPLGKDEHGEVSCWEVATGKRLWQAAHPAAIWATSLFSPDGSTLIVRLAAGEHRIEAWDAATGKPRADWKPRTGANLELRAFSPDGSLLLYTDGQLHAVNVRTGRDRFTLPVSHGPVLFAPDGKSIVTVHRLLRRWDASTGKPLWEDTADRGHDEPTYTLAFSPDGKRLASKDQDSLLIWDLTSHQPKTRVKGRFNGSLAFAADGRTLFAAAEVTPATGGVVGLDAETGKELLKLSTAGAFADELGTTTTRGIRLLADGRVVAVADLWNDDIQQGSATVVWDGKTGKVADKLVLPDDVGNDAVLAPDGRSVVGLRTVFDTRTRAARPLRLEAREDVVAEQFTPDGRFVAGVIHRRDAQQNFTPETAFGFGVWEVASGRLVGRLPLKKCDNFRLTDGGRLVVMLHADRLAVWDVVAGKEILSRPVPGTDGPWWYGSLTVSADGRLAATGHLLGTILLWDLKPGK
jgi:WD40 repeat protein